MNSGLLIDLFTGRKRSYVMGGKIQWFTFFKLLILKCRLFANL